MKALARIYGVKNIVVGASLVVFASITIPATAGAAIMPTFRVNGGDVVAGSSVAVPATACDTAPLNTKAGVAAWNNGTVTAPNFNGSGGQYAVQALANIEQFVSGRAGGIMPAGLSFSNTTVNNPQRLFGGNFGSAPCLSYWQNIPASVRTYNGTDNLASLDSGSYYINRAVTLSGASIPDGKQITLYVSGDAAITGDIRYISTSWTTRSQIPSFRLIVNGNIFIDNAVGNLDGSYVAVPNAGYTTVKREFSSPQTGTISTCSSPSNNFASYDPANYESSKIETVCNNTLTVNGNLAANQIWFLRSRGNDGNLNGAPAETINYGPEVWLAAGDPDDPSVTTTLGDYQSIVGMPPIL